MKPAVSIKGITHQVSIAPPVNQTSTMFIAASIEIIEISDIPKAVFSARLNAICRARIIVSKMIDVISPLKIASSMINNVGHSISVT